MGVKLIVRMLLVIALGFSTGCQPSVSQQDLSFLATQQKPLTAQTVAKHLGETELGPGAFYAYRLKGKKKTVEFWFGPPPTQTTASSIPVEIAVVVVRAEGNKPSIIWPADLKDKDFDEVIATVWPQKR